jgi:AcrR family transcriptional regulator
MHGMAVEKLTPERRRERTRNALLDAAAEVFARRGFNGASLDEIAETAGFTRGAIYKHFEGKEDLFFALMDRLNEQSLVKFDHRFQLSGNAVRDVDAIVEMWKELFFQDEDVAAIGSELYLYELRNPKAREKARAQMQRVTEVVARFMESQGDTHLFKLPVETVSAIFLITSDGFAHAARIDPQAIEVYKTFLEVLIPALIRVDALDD